MAQQVRILGIDPGLRSAGWGVLDCDGNRLTYAACGAITSDAAEPLSERLKQLYLGIKGVIDEWHPDEVSVETTFVNRDAAATLKLGQARGMALVVPALAGIAVFEYAPNLVKKTVVGAGHANKAQIRMMVETLLPRAKVDNEHAADALAVGITHAHHRQSIVHRQNTAAQEAVAP